MNNKLRNELISHYPHLYQKAPPFYCDDGWFSILNELSAKLETMILQEPETMRSQIFCLTMKEKFANLRFYISSGTDAMYAAIHEAEELSAKICERCGRPGELNSSRSWLKTECHICTLLK